MNLNKEVLLLLLFLQIYLNMSAVAEMTEEVSVCMQSVDMDLTEVLPSDTSVQQVKFVYF